jgi:hypothetical protein
MLTILDQGRSLGCVGAWVLTEPENAAANALYRCVARLRDAEGAVAIIYSFKLAGSRPGRGVVPGDPDQDRAESGQL